MHRRDEFRAAPTTVEKARKNEKIEFITSATVKEALGDKMGLTKIVLDTKNGERVLDVPGIFTFVGLNVNNEIFKKMKTANLSAKWLMADRLRQTLRCKLA